MSKNTYTVECYKEGELVYEFQIHRNPLVETDWLGESVVAEDEGRDHIDKVVIEKVSP